MEVSEIIDAILRTSPEKEFTIIVVGGEAFAPKESVDDTEDEADLKEGSQDDIDYEMDFFKNGFFDAIFGPATAVGGGGGGGGDSIVVS